MVGEKEKNMEGDLITSKGNSYYTAKNRLNGVSKSCQGVMMTGEKQCKMSETGNPEN